jgi:hypothetical protein
VANIGGINSNLVGSKSNGLNLDAMKVKPCLSIPLKLVDLVPFFFMHGFVPFFLHDF